MDDRNGMLDVVKAVCTSDFAALGGRALDAAETALHAEPLPPPEQSVGKQLDHWALVEHVFATAGFVKLAWDLFLSARKEGREVKKAEVENAAAERKIVMPSDEEYKKAISEIGKRLMGR